MTVEPDIFLEPWRTPATFHDDEDICSFVARMAAMGTMSVRDFVMKYLDRDVYDLTDMPFRLAIIRRLSILSGQPFEGLARNGFAGTPEKPERPLMRSAPMRTFRGVQLHRDWIGTHKRVAPRTLATFEHSPYARVAWRFLSLPCDLATGEVLISRCPSCGDRLSWEATEVAFCQSCRFDLRTARLETVSAEILEAARSLAGAMGILKSENPGKLDLPAPFSDLPLSRQIRALEWCALLDGKLRRNAAVAGQANVVHGLNVARQWPDALSEIVMLTVRQSTMSDENVRGSFPYILQQLKDGPLRNVILPDAMDMMDRALKTRPKVSSRNLPGKYVNAF